MSNMEAGESKLQTILCGIIKAEMASADKARENAEQMHLCPRALVVGHSEEMFFGVFVTPKENRWWFHLEDCPEKIGAESVQVTFVEEVRVPEELPKVIPKEAEIAPCGSACTKCPMLIQHKCKGCPALLL